jgi:hypothetical protein
MMIIIIIIEPKDYESMKQESRRNEFCLEFLVS